MDSVKITQKLRGEIVTGLSLCANDAIMCDLSSWLTGGTMCSGPWFVYVVKIREETGGGGLRAWLVNAVKRGV